MYHSLIDQENPGIHFVHILKKEFSAQMEWLYNNGYQTLTLPELYDSLVNGRPREKAVVLTFDDGYYSLYEYATPVLRQYGFNATLFLTTAAVGHGSYNILPHCGMYPPEDRPLTWDELREMAQSCWHIEAHGDKHFAHATLTRKELDREITDCVNAIRQHLHVQPDFYCYPYGNYSDETLKMIGEHHFKAAFSVQPGFADAGNDLRRIKRICVDAFDNLERFSLKVTSAYASKREKIAWTIRHHLYQSPLLYGIMRISKKIFTTLKIR